MGYCFLIFIRVLVLSDWICLYLIWYLFDLRAHQRHLKPCSAAAQLISVAFPFQVTLQQWFGRTQRRWALERQQQAMAPRLWWPGTSRQATLLILGTTNKMFSHPGASDCHSWGGKGLRKSQRNHNNMAVEKTLVMVNAEWHR